MISYKNFEPTQDRILVRPHKAEEKTEGGLYLPESMKQDIPGGIILAYGPKVQDYKIDDDVLYGEHAGFRVEVSGEELLLIREADIYAKIKKS